ncbi:MAG TPA: transposase [Desulfuromonadales bacterium]|nr:transposase [Desulfuromonadales bacterium]
MPRHARIDIPGLLHHIIVRGIERRDIFLDDQDREEFLSRFSALLEETGSRCFAWALLDNHFHLLLRPEEGTLASFMRRLLTGYAVVFNLRHNRAGHLFQNRYKSIVCDEDHYLLELVRYIHLNPIRAGKVVDLDDLLSFPWCVHADLLGKSGRSLVDSESVLALFSSRKGRACQLCKTFLADGLKTEKPQKLSRGGKRLSRALNPALAEDEEFDDRILGGGRFVENLLGATGQGAVKTLTLNDLIRLVGTHFSLDPEELAQPSKEQRIVRAKSVISYVAVRRLHIKSVDVAKALGYSSTAVTHAAARGRGIISEMPTLGKTLAGGKL